LVGLELVDRGWGAAGDGRGPEQRR
jgi:hypothetical protein